MLHVRWWNLTPSRCSIQLHTRAKKGQDKKENLRGGAQIWGDGIGSFFMGDPNAPTSHDIRETLAKSVRILIARKVYAVLFQVADIFFGQRGLAFHDNF